MPTPENSARAIDYLPNKRNLAPADVAKFLDCDLSTVYELIHRGVIPANKMLRHYKIPRDKFIEAYERHTVESDE